MKEAQRKMILGTFTEAERHIVNHTVKNFIDSRDEKNKLAQFKFNVTLLAFLAFSGSEAVRVVFRDTFVKGSINLRRLWICFFCFIGLGSVGLSQYKNDSAFFSGIALIGFAFMIVYEGYKKRKKAVDEKDFRGSYAWELENQELVDFYWTPDSLLGRIFGSTKKIPREEATRLSGLYVEPLLFIAFGIAVCFFHPLLGLPFIFCGLSVWVEIVCESIFGTTANEVMQIEVAEVNNKINPIETINEVQIDDD